jgi:hypothetical protein
MGYKGKPPPRWSIEEENTLIELLKNNKSLDECLTCINNKYHNKSDTKSERSLNAIIYRIEYIIYKFITNDNKSIDDIEYLRKYINKDIQSIKEKFKDKKKMDKKTDKDENNEINKNLFDNKNDFEKKVLNELEIIRKKQEEIIFNNINENDKDKEIKNLNKIIDDLKKENKKNERKISELLDVIKKLNT